MEDACVSGCRVHPIALETDCDDCIETWLASPPQAQPRLERHPDENDDDDDIDMFDDDEDEDEDDEDDDLQNA